MMCLLDLALGSLYSLGPERKTEAGRSGWDCCHRNHSSDVKGKTCLLGFTLSAAESCMTIAKGRVTS